MKVFLQNRDFRQLTINQWISTLGDTIFYLAFLNYVADASFAPLAILLITISETLPQVLQIFLGVLADFQHHRVLKYTVISFTKFLLYSIVSLSLSGQSFSLLLVTFICLLNLLSDTLSYFSGAMLTPIFIRIIGQDHLAEAIGFKQSTVSLVKTISNILGGVLLGILSIQFISLLNALTFLIAFLGILFIKTDLLKVEKTISYQEGLSVKSFCQHLLQSSKLIWNMNKVLLVLFIISTSQAVINVTVPISTLFLRSQPFLNLQTGQSLALLATLELSASLMSGYLQHTISIKTALYASLVIQLLLLVGFATVRFDWILIFSTLDAFFAGILSPRLQELVFKQIPEESMGAVQSSIGAITVVLPSLFTIALVTIATSFGTLAVSFVLLLFLLVAFVMLLNIRESI
ncbi:transporter, major facilitator family protein [Streptococcus pneumoniae]|nr:transporter, major facilitator family protein [Streptococcus pneumoniae]VQX76598.1 transporter, major facilitator family protein [Streptococcus pneumoniae]VRW10317.1 transporter, major facilitator family protein [Streptococcus pneumoniae]VRW66492.1 transporter, major facilitator family protein [Streptococcus pneumoniae]VRX20449.1 transporter, major facilitator family protein [Streptococcus pneumoniae]